MPKLKTSKTVSKRIKKLTSTGLIMRRRMSNQHLARRKSKRSRKQNENDTIFSATDTQRIKRMAPYLK